VRNVLSGGVGVGVGVTIGVGLGVAVGVALGVAVGVGRGCGVGCGFAVRVADCCPAFKRPALSVRATTDGTTWLMSEHQNPSLSEDITHLRPSRSVEESGIIEICFSSVSDASKNSRFLELTYVLVGRDHAA